MIRTAPFRNSLLVALTKRCMSAREIGVTSTVDYGCLTFNDMNATLFGFREIQKTVPDGETVVVAAQQRTAAVGMFADGLTCFDSSVFCFIKRASIRCEPMLCMANSACVSANVGERPSLCTRPGNPNKLSCKECAATGQTGPGSLPYVWRLLPDQADGSPSARCGAVPAEFSPIGVGQR